jgi:hypothetical protein
VFHSFQKVTLLPTHALIYSPEDGQEPSEVLSRYLKGLDARDYMLAYALENELSLLCHEDDEALRHYATGFPANGTETAAKINNIAVQTFKELIIPVMEHEIRFGSSFARVRQMYSAMLLSSWVKRVQAEGKIRLPSVDAGSHVALNLPSYKISNLGDATYGSDIEGVTGPDSIGDQRDFYAEYLELFKYGIYQATRRQYDPASRGFVTRVYSSGAFNCHGPIERRTSI